MSGIEWELHLLQPVSIQALVAGLALVLMTMLLPALRCATRGWAEREILLRRVACVRAEQARQGTGAVSARPHRRQPLQPSAFGRMASGGYRARK